MNGTAARTPPKRTVGVLAVHGIGRQERGDLAESLVGGLCRALGEDAPPPGANPTRIRSGDTEIRVYEVYWAERLKGSLIHGTLSWSELTSLAWFPRLNSKYGLYPEGSVRRWEVMVWTPVLGLLAALMAMSQGLLGLFRSLWGAHTDQEGPDLSNAPRGWFRRAVYRAKAHADHGVQVAARPSPLDRLLDDYLGDVTNYVASAGGRALPRTEAGPPPLPDAVWTAYPAILRAFYETADRAAQECDDVQVVAHSLGTVVSFHALAGFRARESGIDPEAHREAIHRISRLYTIGSPLAKIRFLWPRLVPTDRLLREAPLRWENFVSRMDPVAGRLRDRYRQWGNVEDHMTLGGGVLRAHTLYDRNPLFLGRLTQGLIGQPKNPTATWSGRVKGLGLLLGETLVTPALLVGIPGLGAAILLLLPLLIAWVAGKTMALVDPQAAEPVRTWVALLIFGAYVITFLLTAPRTAAERHEVWRETPSELPTGRGPGDPEGRSADHD